MAAPAFIVGLLFAALGTGAEEPVPPRPTAERAGTGIVRAQPTAKQFAPPNQPDLGASEARTVDPLYRLLIGPQSTIPSDTRSITPPSGRAKR